MNNKGCQVLSLSWRAAAFTFIRYQVLMSWLVCQVLWSKDCAWWRRRVARLALLGQGHDVFTRPASCSQPLTQSMEETRTQRPRAQTITLTASSRHRSGVANTVNSCYYCSPRAWAMELPVTVGTEGSPCPGVGPHPSSSATWDSAPSAQISMRAEVKNTVATSQRQSGPWDLL